VTYAKQTSVRVSRTRNRRELARVLKDLEIQPSEDAAQTAWETASRLAALDAPSEVVSFSDSKTKGRWVDVSAAKVTNVGITAYGVRPAPLERNQYEAYVEVCAAAANAAPEQTTVELRVGSRLAHLRELTLAPGGRESLLVSLEGATGEPLEVRISTVGDQLPWDDVVLDRLPVAKPLVVAWLAENPDPFTELALGAMVEAGRVEMWKGGPAQWPVKDKPDVLVLENWLPPEAPAMPVLVLSPPGGQLLQGESLASGLPVDQVRAVLPDHPVVHGVPAGRLSLTQTVKAVAEPGLEPLWMGGDGPLLLAGEWAGARAVVTCFSPTRSESLALQPAYPLLLANAIFWAADGGRTANATQRVGDVVEVQGELRWRTWNGQTVVELTDSVTQKAVSLGRLGAWETPDGQQGVCLLASPKETDVPRRSEAKEGGSASNPGGGWRLAAVSALMWLVLGLVVVESFLFHRHAVY
jgi:hypothetical protein